MIDINRVSELTVEERAYIAGFFDGEGHVTLRYQSHTNRPHVMAGIGQNRPAVLHWIASYFPATITFDKSSNMYKWRLADAGDVRCFLHVIRPYTRVKSQEIDEILQFLKNKDHMTREDIDASIARIREHRKAVVP